MVGLRVTRRSTTKTGVAFGTRAPSTDRERRARSSTGSSLPSEAKRGPTGRFERTAPCSPCACGVPRAGSSSRFCLFRRCQALTITDSRSSLPTRERNLVDACFWARMCAERPECPVQDGLPDAREQMRPRDPRVAGCVRIPLPPPTFQEEIVQMRQGRWPSGSPVREPSPPPGTPSATPIASS